MYRTVMRCTSIRKTDHCGAPDCGSVPQSSYIPCALERVSFATSAMMLPPVVIADRLCAPFDTPKKYLFDSGGSCVGCGDGVLCEEGTCRKSTPSWSVRKVRDDGD